MPPLGPAGTSEGREAEFHSIKVSVYENTKQSGHIHFVYLVASVLDQVP